MRKSLVILTIGLVTLLFLASSALANGYFAVGGGGGGQAEAGNFSIDIGGFSTEKKTNYFLGGGLTSIFSSDIPSNILEYPVPHSDYTSLGRKQDDELGLYMKAGFQVITRKRIFIFGLLGLTFTEEIELAQSNVTGWYYEQSSSTDTNMMIGGGIAYFPENKRFCLQLEYDNRRGVTGSIGFVF